MSDNLYCPVCGSPMSKSGQINCNICGAQYAYSQYFADLNDLETWEKSMNDYKACTTEKTCRSLVGKSIFEAGDRGISFIADDRQLLLQYGSDVFESKDVLQVSFGGRHNLILYKDGHVEAIRISGSVSGVGQYRVTDWKDIVYVEAGANCSYGVKKDGSVIASGIAVLNNEIIEKLKDVKAISESDDFITVLHNSGVLELLPADGNQEKLERLKNAVDSATDIVTVSSAHGFVIALDRNGRVFSFSSEERDSRLRASGWENIISVGVDSRYAVGLTVQGNIKIAGADTELDSGRKKAEEWKNIIAVSCSPSGIGAISVDGKLMLAGNLTGVDSIIDSWNVYSKGITASVISPTSA